MGGGFGPEFTTGQTEQIEKIRERLEDERVELTNRVHAMALEVHDVLEADEPDFGALERKIEEMSEVRVELMKLKLKQHKEIRALLDDDQRTLFDRGFAERFGNGLMMGGHGMGGRGMCGPMAHGGRTGRGAGPMGRGMGGHMGRHPMMQGGTGMGYPGMGVCPWTAPDDGPPPAPGDGSE